MCKISKETVIQANAKTMRRSWSDMCYPSMSAGGNIKISTFHYGKEYSRDFKLSELKASYSRSLKGGCK